MRAVIPALALIGVAAIQSAAASECLRQTAPEVVPWLVAGEQSAIRAAIRAIGDQRLDDDRRAAAPWLTAQASMLLDLGELELARELLDEAVAGWRETSRVEAEVCARHLLAYTLSLQSQPRAALAETRLAEERAIAAGLDWQLNRLRQTRASLLLALNERLEEALLLFELIDPGQSAAEQIGWHHLHGLILGRTNRHRAAAEQFERMLVLAEAESLGRTVATARINLANQLANLPVAALYAGEIERINNLLEQTIADDHAHSSTRAMALTLLARRQSGSMRKDLLEQCVAQARSGQDPRRESVCLADLAALAIDNDPERALALMDEAVFLARDNPRALWQIQARRLDLIWATRPPLQAFEDSVDAIAGERQLRERQLAGPDRAQFIDGLMWDYRRLADRAYAHADRYPELAARAFGLLESNRALVLQERRLGQGARLEDERLRELMAGINQLQRTLIEEPDGAQSVEQVRNELARLEVEWRQAAIEGDPALDLPTAPDLGQLRARLAPEQAILSFLTNIPGEPTRPGHGWLHVIDRNGWQLHSVPDAERLLAAGELLMGFDSWQGGPAADMLKAIGRALLGPALEALPSDVNQLIIVPDSGIETLPLEVLQLADGRTLGLSHALDRVPSASWWFDASAVRHSAGRVLVLADPRRPSNGYRAVDAAFPDQDFEQLPGARKEARRIQRIIGRHRVDSQVDADASEDLLQGPGFPADTRMIHFATHTLIHPERFDASAILLASGGQSTDGLLQPREIEALQLGGVVVVLANCASATGQVLSTEGVVSLARSFLIAGSPAVIATRHAVDDQHAQVYFERLYRHLAAGRNLSQSMQQARADLAGAGYPPQAWSAYILLGTGDLRPVEPVRRWPGLVLITFGLLCALMFVRLFKRQRGQ